MTDATDGLSKRNSLTPEAGRDPGPEADPAPECRFDRGDVAEGAKCPTCNGERMVYVRDSNTGQEHSTGCPRCHGTGRPPGDRDPRDPPADWDFDESAARPPDDRWCRPCAGTGKTGGVTTAGECQECAGTGRYPPPAGADAEGVPCPACGGLGRPDDSTTPCDRCDGRGRVCPVCDGTGGHDGHCKACDSTGRPPVLSPASRVCPSCGGTAGGYSGCVACDSTGRQVVARVPVDRVTPAGQRVRVVEVYRPSGRLAGAWPACRPCDGWGEIRPGSGLACSWCAGTGIEQKPGKLHASPAPRAHANRPPEAVKAENANPAGDETAQAEPDSAPVVDPWGVGVTTEQCPACGGRGRHGPTHNDDCPYCIAGRIPAGGPNCPACRGSGRGFGPRGNAPASCDHCRGTGREMADCPTCDGAGSVEDMGTDGGVDDCPTCDGAGRVFRAVGDAVEAAGGPSAGPEAGGQNAPAGAPAGDTDPAAAGDGQPEARPVCGRCMGVGTFRVDGGAGDDAGPEAEPLLRVPCPDCRGSGRDWVEPPNCTICGGFGIVIGADKRAFYCRECGGTGRHAPAPAPDDGGPNGPAIVENGDTAPAAAAGGQPAAPAEPAKCSTCDGAGRLVRRQTSSVDVRCPDCDGAGRVSGDGWHETSAGSGVFVRDDPAAPRPGDTFARPCIDCDGTGAAPAVGDGAAIRLACRWCNGCGSVQWTRCTRPGPSAMRPCPGCGGCGLELAGDCDERPAPCSVCRGVKWLFMESGATK